MTRGLTRIIAAALFAAGPACAQRPAPWEAKPFGILLLGHGGSSQWNRAFLEVRKALAAKYPTEAAFGMADPIAIQRAVDLLAARKVKKIVAVPVFISSHSEVMEQTKYVLGMRKDPSPDFVNAPHAHMGHVVVKRIRLKLPIVMTSALDDHPIVAEILLDRAREMSRNPARESVLLVGHGPLKKEDNELWLRYMNNLARQVQAKGGFAAVRSATLRDDSPQKVRQEADRILWEMVRDLGRKGRVIVVPHLIAPGGIERHIRQTLEGQFYEWKGRTLLPDARLAKWAEEAARRVAELPDMRQFKDAGHALPQPERKRIIQVER